MNKETRMCKGIGLETRTGSEENSTPMIVGYAVVFDSLSEDLGGFKEQVRRGAFASSLAKGDEVHALFNHDDDKLLGRRAAGTLRLEEDDHGLRIEIDPPNTTDGNNVVELLRRGDLISMSFGFYNVQDSWETKDSEDIRTIESATLFDVSVVTNPAYKETFVDVRSLKEYKRNQVDNVDFDSIGETIDLRLKLRLAEEK